MKTIFNALAEGGFPQPPISIDLAERRITGFDEDTSEADRIKIEAIVAGFDWDGTSLDSRKAAKIAEIDAKRFEIVAGGFRYNFGGNVGIRILSQIGPNDLTYWIGLKLLAQDANSNDDGTRMLDAADANGSMFSVKAASMEGAMGEMGLWQAAVMKRAWQLQKQAADASSIAELDAIDINSGWTES